MTDHWPDLRAVCLIDGGECRLVILRLPDTETLDEWT